MYIKPNADKKLALQADKRKKGLKKVALTLCSLGIYLSVVSPANAANMDDLREMLGKQRMDEVYTSDKQSSVIAEYNRIEAHNRLSQLLAESDPTGLNVENKKKREKLLQDIEKQEGVVKENFASGASVPEVLKAKATLDNLHYAMSKLPEERSVITIEPIKNNLVKEYQAIVKNMKEVESYVDIGIVGNMLLSPLKDSLVLKEAFGFRIDPKGGYATHHGLDLKAKLGDEVYSTWRGVVTEVTTASTGGITVVVTHDNGLKTRYLRMQKAYVKKGQKVNQYAKLGQVGDKGEAKGAYLHYEVLLENKPVNPIYFFGDKGRQALDNFIMVSEDPIIRSMSEILPNIKTATKAELAKDKGKEKPLTEGEKDVKYERNGSAPKGSIEVQIEDGYSMPKPNGFLE